MIRVEPLTKQDTVGWRQLWRMNVGTTLEKPVLDHTEQLLLSDASPLFGLVAKTAEGEVIGLLHGVVHPVAGSLNPVCYMQDLFVHPARRRQGIATQLIDALTAKGRADKWDRIYWLTERGNTSAQALYNARSVSLDFSFHILPIGMLDKLGV